MTEKGRIDNPGLKFFCLQYQFAKILISEIFYYSKRFPENFGKLFKRRKNKNCTHATIFAAIFKFYYGETFS